MLADKLKAKEIHVQKREEFAALVADFQRRYMPAEPSNAAHFFASIQQILTLNWDLAQAPVLFTLQSAAEVGFAHANMAAAQEPSIPESHGSTDTEVN